MLEDVADWVIQCVFVETPVLRASSYDIYNSCGSVVWQRCTEIVDYAYAVQSVLLRLPVNVSMRRVQSNGAAIGVPQHKRSSRRVCASGHRLTCCMFADSEEHQEM